MYKIVFVTAAEKDGSEIAEKLVTQKLAACVNIIPVRSIYKWKGKIDTNL